MNQEPTRGVEAPPVEGPPPSQAPDSTRPAPIPLPTPVHVTSEPGPLAGMSDFRLARLGIALTTLAAAGASVVLTVYQASFPANVFQRYLGSNQLPKAFRTEILIAMLIGAALPALLALAHLLFKRAHTGERAVLRAGAVASPLVLLWTFPSLVAHRIWFDSPLAYLVFLSAVLLAEERLLRFAFAALPRPSGDGLLSERARDFIGFGVVTLAALGYAVYAGYYTILEHKRLATAAYDLGIYDNLISNNLAGKFFRNPVLGPGLNYLSNHAEFGTLLFAPIYALRPESSTLLGLQAAFLGGAAIPLYLFAKTQLPRVSAVLIACGYLLYAPLHGANFYDFHWVPMALPLWFGLYYAIVTRKIWLIVTSVCVLLTIREEVGVMLAVLGVFLAASGYWVRLGVALAAIGTASFAILKFVVMPLAGSWWFSGMYQQLIAPGEEGYGSVIKTLLVNPSYVWKTLATEAKLTYFLHLLAPLAFLPFRKPLLVFLAIPGFFFTLLTTSYEPTISIRFQYTAHWIPWVFGASVLAMKLLSNARGLAYQRAAVCTLAIGIFAHSYVYGAILQRDTFIGGFHKVAFGMSEEERERYDVLRRMISKIPKNASVAATESECPHIANRVDAYTLRIAHGDSDFILVRRGAFGGEERRQISAALANREYGLLDEGKELFLFKRGHHNPSETRAALRRLGISLGSNSKTQKAIQNAK